MLGLMQDWPLLCHRIIEHAARIHGKQEVVTRSVEGPIHRTNYAEIHKRALKVSQMLERDGIKLGDRVATIAWNTWRHLEVWYGIMGIGAICHTVNPRLFPDRAVWTQRTRWQLALHRASFVIEPTLAPGLRAFVQCGGEYRLEPLGAGGTRRIVDGEIRVRVPTLGSRIERAVVSLLATHFPAEARLLGELVGPARESARTAAGASLGSR